MRLPKRNLSAPKLHRRLESVFNAWKEPSEQRRLPNHRQTDATPPRREPQSLSYCLPPLCHTLLGCSAATVLQKLHFSHDCAVFLESRCASTRVRGTALHHRSSLEPVACVDTATRQIQYQQWRHHGYRERVTTNECLSECWIL